MVPAKCYARLVLQYLSYHCEFDIIKSVTKRIPVYCSKTKTKGITMANPKRCKQHNESISI